MTHHIAVPALLLALLVALAGLPAAAAQDQPIDLDLRTWTQEGPADWGAWEVGDGGREVIQTINHSPTFFVSPDTFASASIDGVFEVQTSSDDDYIGFVMGYRGPRSPDTTGDDFLVFNWKQHAQSHAGCDAEEGMSLLRVVGQEDPDADYTPSGDAHPALWCHSQQALDDRGYDMDVDVLDTRWGEDTGWEDQTEYRFTLHYTPTNIRIEIDGQTVFDVDGTFPAGAFGFYNYSQSDVRYSGFTARETPDEDDPADRPAPGDPGVSRIGADDATGDVRDIAIETCQVVRPDQGSASRVLISRDDAFADALAGSALLNVDSCILFTEGGPDATLDPRVRAEIDRVLIDGGELSLLGGTNAVSQAVEDELRAAGYSPQRFAGETRYETAVQIARVAQALQADGTSFEAILAYGEDWPDAVTAGAYAAARGTPVVLTPTEQLHPETRGFLDGGPPIDRTWVIGGEEVISGSAAQAVPNPVRVAGGNRMATAAAIAEQMWSDVPASGEDFVFVNLEHPQGWTLALGAAPLAALLSAPELGVRSGTLPSETATYLESQGFTDLPAAVLLGDLSFISSQVEEEVGTVIQPDDGAPDDDTPARVAARVTVATDRSTMTIGGLAQITATVRDDQAQPVPGADVRVEVTDGSGALVEEGTETTDPAGEAVFTYGAGEPGEHTITACTLPDGRAPTACTDTTAERRDSTVIVWETEDA